jgi:arsenite methyltransferase
MNVVPHNDEQLQEAVRTQYAGTTFQVLEHGSPRETSCCGPSCCTPQETVATQPTSSCCVSSCCTPERNSEDASPLKP